MSSEQRCDEDGNVWSMTHKIDEPMDQEASRLRNMYKEKVF